LRSQGADLEVENNRLLKRIAQLEADLRAVDDRLYESAQHLVTVTEVAERAVAERDERASTCARVERQRDKALAKASMLEDKVEALQAQTREELLDAADMIHRQSNFHMTHSKKLHRTINHLRDLAVHTEAQ
jgi:hypothetical protein